MHEQNNMHNIFIHNHKLFGQAHVTTFYIQEYAKKNTNMHKQNNTLHSHNIMHTTVPRLPLDTALWPKKELDVALSPSYYSLNPKQYVLFWQVACRIEISADGYDTVCLCVPLAVPTCLLAIVCMPAAV